MYAVLRYFERSDHVSLLVLRLFKVEVHVHLQYNGQIRLAA